ncbi:hypothetical protein ASPNIDRAFT_37759 [Aspergillus niger ATCC 1015]|uniref:Uncharacterized protein n=1 Tax=Aspergillus niger (strain ATCC 1015 / CBS 113.46 / FGSC A1144 / LSHB Ac4 / NCTC 3858a / NRRL 328 / USDA 3528.7) TaxID=380704 RepID=G3YGF8_ASPNA|nr:hypothetical protein ASPNIDRAFT_37759 [Aspergillus niger ATCC 1015]
MSTKTLLFHRQFSVTHWKLMGTAFVVLRVLELSCLYWRKKSCWLSCWLGRGMDFGARFELSAMPYSSLTRYRKEQCRLMVWFVGLFGLLLPENLRGLLQKYIAVIVEERFKNLKKANGSFSSFFIKAFKFTRALTTKSHLDSVLGAGNVGDTSVDPGHYLKPAITEATDKTLEVAARYGIGGHAAAFRWTAWYSILSKLYGDSITASPVRALVTIKNAYDLATCDLWTLS